MPIHDWTRVDSGLFHAFHQGWVCALCGALNAGTLPPEYYALPTPNGRSRASHLPRTEAALYADRADRVTVRHRSGRIVSAIEMVSPGNKEDRVEVQALVNELADLIRDGVHLLVVDLFSPGKHDIQGVPSAIWRELHKEGFDLPPDRPLVVASFTAGAKQAAYVEPVTVGDRLPDLPLFLTPDIYIQTPLEATYQTTWDKTFPAPLKGLLEPPHD